MNDNYRSRFTNHRIRDLAVDPPCRIRLDAALDR
jgi:hypothetical protein